MSPSQLRLGLRVVAERDAVPRAPVEHAADRGISRGLWVFLCVVFLSSAVISVTGLIMLISWIARL